MSVSFKSIFGDTDKETLSGLRKKFWNTPFYQYLPIAIPFFFKEAHSWEDACYSDTRSGVRIYIDETLQLALLLRELKNCSIKGKGWRIDSREDALRLYDSVESLFFKKIDDFPVVLHRYEWEEFSTALLAEWEKALEDFPYSGNFEKEDKEIDDEGNEVENGDSRLSQVEIDDAIKEIQHCKKIADKFFIDSDDAVAKRFVAYMIEKGVPESRQMYRCFYDVLDCFNGIPSDVKISHLNYPGKEDPKSNYIKAIASRVRSRKR